MQYNGEANGQDICSVADDFAGTDSVSFPIEQKTRAANMGWRIIASWIYAVYGGWIFDDSNQTDIPEGTAQLTADQQLYILPPETGDLLGVAYKDTAGNWHKLDPITLEEIEQTQPEKEFQKISGSPTYYRPVANGFKIYPAANFTQASSIGVFTNRDISPFTVDDDEKKPGFDPLFHEALSVFMALYYARKEVLDKARSLQEMFDGNEDESGAEGGYKKRIKQHYAMKFKQLSPPKFNKRRDVVGDYI